MHNPIIIKWFGLEVYNNNESHARRFDARSQLVRPGTDAVSTNHTIGADEMIITMPLVLYGHVFRVCIVYRHIWGTYTHTRIAAYAV